MTFRGSGSPPVTRTQDWLLTSALSCLTQSSTDKEAFSTLYLRNCSIVQPGRQQNNRKVISLYHYGVPCLSQVPKVYKFPTLLCLKVAFWAGSLASAWIFSVMGELLWDSPPWFMLLSLLHSCWYRREHIFRPFCEKALNRLKSMARSSYRESG